MEITNQNPHQYRGQLRNDVLELIELFFPEYDFIETEVLEFFGKQFLVMHSQGTALKEMKRSNGSETLAAVGAGGGAELTPYLQRELSPVIIDHQDPGIVRRVLGNNHGNTPARIVCNGSDVFEEEVTGWRKDGSPPTLFIAGNIDMTQADTDTLHQLRELLNPGVAYSNEVLHEIPDELKASFIAAMGNLTNGSIVITDSLPLKGALNVALSVFERLESHGIYLPLDLHGAVVSHLISNKPNESIGYAKSAKPEYGWKHKVHKEPPKPLLSTLQYSIVGRP